MNAPAKGRFITVEGTEGVGKSTNIDFIRQLLDAADIPYIVSREPGGTPLAEEIRGALLQPRDEKMCELTELLLVFAARAQHINQLILPALVRGDWVLCDRFTDATFAYQGWGRGLSVDVIRNLERMVQGQLRPDCTVLLDAPVEVGMARAGARGNLDRFELEKHDFFEKVRQGYLARVAAEPQRFKLIDASAELACVQRDIATALAPQLSAYKRG